MTWVSMALGSKVSVKSNDETNLNGKDGGGMNWVHRRTRRLGVTHNSFRGRKWMPEYHKSSPEGVFEILLAYD